MVVLSLFDGMSCGQVALSRAGIRYESYFASEIEQSSMRVTMANYPNTIQIGNVTDVKARDLPHIDLLIGGSPCQGFSVIGNLNKKQLNFEDPRSKLFFEYVRILQECGPEYFLLENVNMKEEYRKVISEILGVSPTRINSKMVSAAKRDRLYWTNIPHTGISTDLGITFDDVNSGGQEWFSDEAVNRVRNWTSQQDPLQRAVLIGSRSKLPCLTARGYNQNHAGMILITDGRRYRYLSNDEAERAMTLPVGYTEMGTDRERSRMIGNGWTVDVIAHILAGLK